MTEQTRELAVMQFKSSICCCGKQKMPRQPLCTQCYLALPKEMRRPLVGTYGERFEVAYFAAVDWLVGRRANEVVNPSS